MTEVEVAKRLASFLEAIDAEATVLNPGREKLEEIVLSHPRGPRASGPYALITILGFRDTREANFSCYEEVEVQIGPEMRIIENPLTILEYGLRVDIYARNSADILRLFNSALTGSRGRTDLLPMVVRSVSRAGRDPELVTQHWEERSNFTVTLAATVSDRIPVDVIESGSIAFEGDGATERSETSPFTKD